MQNSSARASLSVRLTSYPRIRAIVSFSLVVGLTLIDFGNTNKDWHVVILWQRTQTNENQAEEEEEEVVVVLLRSIGCAI